MPYSLGFHIGFYISHPLITFENYEEEIKGREIKCSIKELRETKLLTNIKSKTMDVNGEKGKRIRLSSPFFTTLVIWSPKGGNGSFLAIEPRIDTIPLGAEEPFASSLIPGEKVMMEERIEILE